MQGVLKPFCDLLAAKDDKTVCVVLDGLTNILATAEKLGEVDKVAMMVEECGGLDRIEALQTHENEAIYAKALQIIETFFPDGDQVEIAIGCQPSELCFNSSCRRSLMRSLPKLAMPGSSSPLRRTPLPSRALIFRNSYWNINCHG